MGRKTKKQKFIDYVLYDIQTGEITGDWHKLKTALYVEQIQHLKQNKPTLLYDALVSLMDYYWDYQQSVDSNITKEELINEIGDLFDTDLIHKLTDSLYNTTVL